MYHLVLHARPGTVLFRTWEEARALWDQIVGRVHFRALSLMPTHVHLDPPDEAQEASLAIAKRAYANWRNRHRGESGPVWVDGVSRRTVEGESYIESTRLYIHQNPCRARLVTCPLAWPFSCHRDICGFALPPACRRDPDPAGAHFRVSSTKRLPDGTRFPEPRPDTRDLAATLDEVFAAVSALMRTPERLMRRHGPGRDLFIRAARTLSKANSSAIAARVGVDDSTVRHARPLVGPTLVLLTSVLGDPRFDVLHDRDLRLEPTWREYRNLR